MDLNAISFQTIFFWIIALWTAVCAIGVVVTQNIVRAATWLLFSLAGVAGVFFLLGADFVAASQLLIYVGGTLVLVVFGVMLTAHNPFVSLKTSAVEWAVSVVAGCLLFGVLAVGIISTRPSSSGADLVHQHDQNGDGVLDAKERTKLPEELVVSAGKYAGEDGRLDYHEADRMLTQQVRRGLMGDPEDSHNSVVIGEALLGYTDATPKANLTGFPNGKTPPARHQIGYLLPFEIVSVHLLVVLIGAAYLARARRRRGAATT